MEPILIANLISLAGCSLMVRVGFLRKKETILTVQCFQFGLQGLSHLILGGISGLISAVISIIRNLVFFRGTKSLPMKLLFIGIQLLFSIGALKSGWVEWLPIFATAILTLYLDTPSERKLKKVLIVTVIFWLIYDLRYLNFTSAAFDVFTILSNFIGILMLRKNTKSSDA